jgi:hypothetical protein
MAKLTLAFIADAIGNHIIGFREIDMSSDFSGTNPYGGNFIYNVQNTGIQYVDINLPGSLYCGDLHMTGYVAPECGVNFNNITGNVTELDPLNPRIVTWSRTIDKVQDPCKNIKIVCDNVGVETVTLSNIGKGYPVGSQLTVVFDEPSSGVAASGIAKLGNGVVTDVAITSGGTGYTNGTFENVRVLRAGQVATDGDDLTLKVVISAGVISSLEIMNPGYNYSSNDDDATLTLDHTTISAPGGSPAVLNITCNGSFADQIHSFYLTSEGQGYTSTPNITILPALTPSATEINGVLTVTALESCPVINLGDYTCKNIENFLATNPTYTLNLGDDLNLCASELKLNNLPTEFKIYDEGNCKCLGCEKLIIDTSSATSGEIKITYNQCWDRGDGESLVTTKVAFGQVNQTIDCIIPETFIFESTLNAPATITYQACDPI